MSTIVKHFKWQSHLRVYANQVKIHKTTHNNLLKSCCDFILVYISSLLECEFIIMYEV